MILAIDAGNSRIKWAVAADTRVSAVWEAEGVLPNAELPQTAVPDAWRQCTRTIISNVAGAEVAQQLAAMLQALGIPAHWAAATAHACNVHNSYADPRQLGSDRWAAAVAAWQLYKAPCVIASAGTALTVDALGAAPEGGQGVFLGGLIVPGLHLMRHSLANGTASLPAEGGSWQDFPDNTCDALHSGALSAMAGAILLMLQKLQQREGMVPHCILSGGDAALLAQALQKQADLAQRCVIVDNLVLHGLLLIERER